MNLRKGWVEVSPRWRMDISNHENKGHWSLRCPIGNGWFGVTNASTWWCEQVVGCFPGWEWALREWLTPAWITLVVSQQPLFSLFPWFLEWEHDDGWIKGFYSSPGLCNSSKSRFPHKQNHFICLTHTWIIPSGNKSSCLIPLVFIEKLLQGTGLYWKMQVHLEMKNYCHQAPLSQERHRNMHLMYPPRTRLDLI